MGGAPFTDHPFVTTIPAQRATWEAERTRLTGASDPAEWGWAAKAWQDLGCPHRAGYAWWRQAQARLDAAQPAKGLSWPKSRRSQSGPASLCTNRQLPPARARLASPHHMG